MFNNLHKFAKIRKSARAYLCYLLNRNLPNKLPNITYDLVESGIYKLLNEVDSNIVYVLDSSGKQISNNISNNIKYKNSGGKDENRGNRGYFYRAVNEKKCILTDPYPSIITQELCVSASLPIYDDKGELQFVVVIDLALSDIIKAVHIQTGDKLFQNASKIVYSAFSFALFMVAMVLFFNGVKSFFSIGIHLDVKDMFTSTILLTLSLAIFDLVKTILQEEVIGEDDDNQPSHIHKTMIKFLGSIIIAIAIEALMLVFKFALTAPEKLIYAAYLIGGVTFLIVGLAYYLKSVNQCKIGDFK